MEHSLTNEKENIFYISNNTIRNDQWSNVYVKRSEHIQTETALSKLPAYR